MILLTASFYFSVIPAISPNKPSFPSQYGKKIKIHIVSTRTGWKIFILSMQKYVAVANHI